MAHAKKPDFVFRRKGRVHLNRWGRQFSRLLAAEVCGSAVVMLDTPCSEVVWRVLGTHSIRQFLLQFPSRASPCAITFQMDSTKKDVSENGSASVVRQRKRLLWWTPYRALLWVTVNHGSVAAKKKILSTGKVKVKRSHYRPGQAMRVPGGLGSQDFKTFGTWRW
jgi:hypothetical protein